MPSSIFNRLLILNVHHVPSMVKKIVVAHGAVLFRGHWQFRDCVERVVPSRFGTVLMSLSPGVFCLFFAAFIYGKQFILPQV